MADVYVIGSGSSSPAPGSIHTPSPTPPDVPTKGKGRRRFLRGIQRISSTPSLPGLRRSRSVGSPYSTRTTLSCVSLAGTGPSTPHRGGSSTPQQPSPLGYPSASTTTTYTSTGEFPFESIASHLAIRRIENGTPASSYATVPLPADIKAKQVQKPRLDFWGDMPQEIQIQILSFLRPKELVRASLVSRAFYKACFDGQLWGCLDATEFYQDISAEALSKIITLAGPFVKDLNLRGCVQVEHYKRTDAIVKCKNLMNVTLEGCQNFQKHTLHSILRGNEKLVRLNLTGLNAVSNTSCTIIAEACPQLETFNISWCSRVDGRGVKAVVEGCPRLKDLRVGEIGRLDDLELAEAIFKTNNLETLIMGGCSDLNDEALKTMIHGVNPEFDILTDLPVVPPRKLRQLDLSSCIRLTDAGVKALAHNVPNLAGLQLSGCKLLTDSALEPILASTPHLTLLELEDLNNLTNTLLSEHLCNAPCVKTLRNLSLSYCEEIGDTGVHPLMEKCVGLRSIELDNTRISDFVLTEAAAMVNKRSKRSVTTKDGPKMTLKMTVYDCQNVTWTGIREVLFRNTQVKPIPGKPGRVSYPTEIIGLKCFYGYQMTVDEHQKRVLRNDLAAAGRLERKWADYMQATEELGISERTGRRRRRRRAREAQALHLDEEGDGVIGGTGRRRARTLGSCTVM
ncbi:hypothetical protein B0T10DRAFT_172438 [Thelonectria olida]|uniref:F-box domain-containing protein n=1 Tax=Thelonectria olida TaxID=1576542 RepID=A0A9P8WCE5_9HYPO|nr:hypothetical protein B0T10DRAFT_172438 [Thelonectria olida]